MLDTYILSIVSRSDDLCFVVIHRRKVCGSPPLPPPSLTPGRLDLCSIYLQPWIDCPRLFVFDGISLSFVPLLRFCGLVPSCYLLCVMPPQQYSLGGGVEHGEGLSVLLVLGNTVMNGMD